MSAKAPDPGSSRISRVPVPPPWDKGIAPRLIHLASQGSPPELAARLEEEWLADLSAQASTFKRWQFALGCCWAALMIRHEHPVAVEAQRRVHASRGDQVMTAYAHRGASHMPASPAAAAPVPVICDINTTPLIDVLLVLLVTLIVTLPVVTHAVKLDLPHGTPLPQVPQVLNLEVDFDGTVVWNGAAVPFGRLDGYFNAEARKQPQAQVQLRADRRAKYGVVAQVLASAQRNGMQRIGFVDTGTFKDD